MLDDLPKTAATAEKAILIFPFYFIFSALSCNEIIHFFLYTHRSRVQVDFNDSKRDKITKTARKE